MSLAMNQDAVNVSEKDFESAVLTASRSRPVVVDFWAPWCGPCRVLGPILEKLAKEQNGALVLAKVNVDENPGLASRYGIRGIPVVKAFRDAKLVAEFVGALPEGEVRSFLAKLIPSEGDGALVEGKKLEEEGRREEAEGIYRAALEREPRHSGLLLALSAILVGRGEDDDALDLLDRVTDEPEQVEANRIAARLKFRKGAPPGEEEKYRQRIASDPSDLEARFALARLSASREEYEEALDHLVAILKKDRRFQNDQPRKTMLEIFEVVGPRSPLAEKYRAEMAKLLFS